MHLHNWMGRVRAEAAKRCGLFSAKGRFYKAGRRDGTREKGGGSDFWSLRTAVSVCIWIEADYTQPPTLEQKTIWLHQRQEGNSEGGGEGGGRNNNGCIKMVNNGIQKLSPELKWNMRFSLSSRLKPCVLLMWFIKQLSQPRPPRQMHSIGYEEEIPGEAATGCATGSPTTNLFPASPTPTPAKENRKRKEEGRNLKEQEIK